MSINTRFAYSWITLSAYLFDLDQVWVHDHISFEFTRAHDTELMPVSCWLLQVKEQLICKIPCVYKVNPFRFLNKIKMTDVVYASGGLFLLWDYVLGLVLFRIHDVGVTSLSESKAKLN